MGETSALPTMLAICCENLKRQVSVTIGKWEIRKTGSEEIPHFWTNDCPCGTEHFGFARWGYVEISNRVANSAEKTDVTASQI